MQSAKCKIRNIFVGADARGAPLRVSCIYLLHYSRFVEFRIVYESSKLQIFDKGENRYVLWLVTTQFARELFAKLIKVFAGGVPRNERSRVLGVHGYFSRKRTYSFLCDFFCKSKFEVVEKIWIFKSIHCFDDILAGGEGGEAKKAFAVFAKAHTRGGDYSYRV